MSDENSTSVDLFGNPYFEGPARRGRPPFERTEENARKVSMLLAMGWSNSRIASVIRDPRTGKSISEPTLKRHFRSELKVRDFARDQMTARQLMQAWGAAEEGNVGAMRFFDQLKDKNDLMQAEDRVRRKPPEAPKVEKAGKKVLQQNEAQDAEDRMKAKVKKEANAARLN